MPGHYLTRAAALGLTLAALAAPAAVAQQDLRSPDAQDAARTALGLTQPAQDLRSPDTRDVSYRPFAVVKSPAPAAQPASRDWTGRAIGAGGALLIVLLVAGAVALHGRRRRSGGRLIAALADGTRDWRRGAGL